MTPDKTKIVISIHPVKKGFRFIIMTDGIDSWFITQEELNALGRLCDQYRTDKPRTYEIPKL